MVEVESYGVLAGGEPVRAFALSTAAGLRARVAEWGATLLSLRVPDARGQPGEVTLGLDSLEDYRAGHPHLGSICGRVANRIRDARFELDGRAHALIANAGPHHLHGGPGGFHARLWRGEPAGEAGVELGYTSADGEQGYPGRLEVRVRYALSDLELRLDYTATCDAPTPVNLTQHSYFNLAGPGADLAGHVLGIEADHYLPMGEGLVPRGERASVSGTPFDFRSPKLVGLDLGGADPQLELAGGYDHCFCLRGGTAREPRPVARLAHAASGRALELWTTEPGLQLYTGNSLDGSHGGGGVRYRRHGALCLEAQRLPDAVHHPDFGPIFLRPGESYRQVTIWRFGFV